MTHHGEIAALLNADFPGDVADRVACMLAAYFDESGTHKGSRALAVAGYVSHTDKWTVFSREWGDALKDFGDLPFFHMTDYARNKRGYQWGRKREPRFNRLMTIINRNVEVAVGIALDMDAWEKHVQTPDEKRFFGSSPYELCATTVMGIVGLWCDYVGHTEGIAYTYERGAPGHRQFHDTYNKAYDDPRLQAQYRLNGGVSFRDKRKFPPLQPADIAAYQVHKERPRQRGLDSTSSRKTEIERLLGVPGYWYPFDDAMFTEIKRDSSSPDGGFNVAYGPRGPLPPTQGGKER